MYSSEVFWKLCGLAQTEDGLVLSVNTGSKSRNEQDLVHRREEGESSEKVGAGLQEEYHPVDLQSRKCHLSDTRSSSYCKIRQERQGNN